MPIKTTPPTWPASRHLDALFSAAEVPADERRELPQHAALRACLRGELPAGSLPSLAGEHAGSSVSGEDLVKDLKRVVGHFAERRQHTGGLAALLCLCAAELSEVPRKDWTVHADHAATLPAAARTLSRCLDAREEWARILPHLERRMHASGADLLVPRWFRLIDLSIDVARVGGDPVIDPKSPGVLTGEHVSALCRRTAALADMTGAMLASASALSSLVGEGAQDDRRLRDLMSTYEAIVAEALRRAVVPAGPAAQTREAAVRRHIAAYDGMRAEVLLLDGQMSAMRDALLGAPAVATNADPGAGGGALYARVPAAMIWLSPPSSCASFSSSDNEGVPDPPVQTAGLSELFERG